MKEPRRPNRTVALSLPAASNRQAGFNVAPPGRFALPFLRFRVAPFCLNYGRMERPLGIKPKAYRCRGGSIRQRITGRLVPSLGHEPSASRLDVDPPGISSVLVDGMICRSWLQFTSSVYNLPQQQRKTSKPFAIVCRAFDGDRRERVVPIRLVPLHGVRQVLNESRECRLVGNLEKHEVLRSESVLFRVRECGVHRLRCLMARRKITPSHDVELRILGGWLGVTLVAVHV